MQYQRHSVWDGTVHPRRTPLRLEQAQKFGALSESPWLFLFPRSAHHPHFPTVGADVVRWMAAWTSQPGFPLVTVGVANSGGSASSGSSDRLRLTAQQVCSACAPLDAWFLHTCARLDFGECPAIANLPKLGPHYHPAFRLAVECKQCGIRNPYRVNPDLLISWCRSRSQRRHSRRPAVPAPAVAVAGSRPGGSRSRMSAAAAEAAAAAARGGRPPGSSCPTVRRVRFLDFEDRLGAICHAYRAAVLRLHCALKAVETAFLLSFATKSYCGTQTSGAKQQTDRPQSLSASWDTDILQITSRQFFLFLSICLLYSSTSVLQTKFNCAVDPL